MLTRYAFIPCRNLKLIDGRFYARFFCSEANPSIDSAHSKKLYQWKQPSGHDTGIKLANSYRCLGKRRDHIKVPFIVKDPQNVTWYACGPTVYDKAHLGHGSTYVRFDIIRRVLTHFFNLKVNYVMGITNIDDKIITRAATLGKDFFTLADEYEQEFKSDMKSLNVLPPSMYVSVSDVLPQIMTFVHSLLEKGFAYRGSNGNVWFNVDNFTDEGRLAYIIEEWPDSTNQFGGEKRSSKDFALWKGAKPGEPYWEAPWGNGRPGWHVECSTISSLMFGDQLDVHTGAYDLCVPHHECEIFQSEAFHDCEQWVNYFIHSGHLLPQGSSSKMSKSIGNVISIKDYLYGGTSDEFRMFCLSQSLRFDLIYSNTAIKSARGKLRGIKKFLTNCKEYAVGNLDGSVDAPEVHKLLEKTRREVLECLRDDFDTPGVLACIDRLVDAIGSMLGSRVEVETWRPGYVIRDPGCVLEVYHFVEDLFGVLGFTGVKAAGATLDQTRFIDEPRNVELVDAVTDFRTRVRHIAFSLKKERLPFANELFKACDTMRDRLKVKGSVVKDEIKL